MDDRKGNLYDNNFSSSFAQRSASANGSGSQVFKSDLHIVSVNGTGSAVGVLTGSDDPRPNYEYVRIGST